MSMSNSLPQCHAYVPGTRLELQSPVRQDWWDLRDGRLRYLWRISQELEPNTDTAGHRRSASISRCPHTLNCVAGHRPLRRAPSSTAPVPNGPRIAEECPTNFGPMQCNLTFHSPCVRMWSAALWNASTFSTVPKRTHAIKVTTKMIRYCCNHFLTRICQWFERKIRIFLLPSTALANAIITRMQIIKPKGEEG